MIFKVSTKYPGGGVSRRVEGEALEWGLCPLVISRAEGSLGEWRKRLCRGGFTLPVISRVEGPWSNEGIGSGEGILPTCDIQGGGG